MVMAACCDPSFVETRIAGMWREQIPIFRGSSISRTEFSAVAENVATGAAVNTLIHSPPL
jgi:hypothetical protein